MKKNQSYTEEFKAKAVKFALKHSYISKAAKQLGIPCATLYNWVVQAKQASEKEMDKTDPLKGKEFVTNLLEENKRLKKELDAIKQEQTILKKAEAYFQQKRK